MEWSQVLVATQSCYYHHHSVVIYMDLIYMDDWDWEGASRVRGGCSSKWYEFRDMINQSEWSWIKSTWEMLKKDGDFAP